MTFPEHVLANFILSGSILLLTFAKIYAARNMSPAPVKSSGLTLSGISCAFASPIVTYAPSSPEVMIISCAYFFKKLIWNDITGDSTIQSETEFNNMKCAEIITEAYIYDVFEEDGREYVRTFASYSIKNNEYGYGDRNC